MTSPARPSPLADADCTGGDDDGALQAYIDTLVHAWSKTLAALALTLVPIFFILDYFVLPAELLTRFAAYRLATVVLVLVQLGLIRVTRPSRWSVLHGYSISLIVGGAIALMTTDLGGFNSAYYAGLNLVLMAVTVLLPWSLLHSALNSLLVVALYVVLNLAFPSSQAPEIAVVVNNLYFLLATAVISVSVSYVKHRLVKQEFCSRQELKKARDALWGEMEVAKQIQTSLLPTLRRVKGYRMAATMQPADEVGGDYYDVIETQAGETWLAIGDVSGHGVESGLIMMMTQTSLYTAVNRGAGLQPSQGLAQVNRVIRQNISRLGADRYMTLSALVLRNDGFTVAGKHQDILIYRRASQQVETVCTRGTWIGVVDDISVVLHDDEVRVDQGDIVLLYTDGVTEAANAEGEMFGERRLREALVRYAALEVGEIVRHIVAEVRQHMVQQEDDVTMLIFQRE